MRESIAGTFLANQGRKLREIRRRIECAIRQMSDEDVNWRPNDQSNSVANLVVHICGNIAQRYLSGLSATPDVRHREAEFSLEQWHTVPDLLQMLAEAFDTVDAIFTGLDAEKLLAPQTVRGRTVTLLDVVAQSTAHYSEHLGQLLYVAKLRLGASYQVSWEPPKRST